MIVRIFGSSFSLSLGDLRLHVGFALDHATDGEGDSS